MKKILILCLVLIAIRSWSQTGEELMVYSVKGEVLLLENNKETRLKIGKVLKPGSIIRVQKESRITLVCKQGKPISVLQEGVFPVTIWKDSCKTHSASLTSNYFQYIWNQLYNRSPEGRAEAERKGDLAVVREGAPLRGETINSVKIEFHPGLDTINYTEGDFPISWNTPYYEGKFFFQLFTREGKLVFKDSVNNNQIMMSRFSRLLKPGKTYRWIIGTKGASIRRARIINFVSPIVLKNFIESIDSLDVPEDPAAVYFRIGFMLESNHFLPHVQDYYKRAVELDRETELYRDKYRIFCKEYKLSCAIEE